MYPHIGILIMYDYSYIWLAGTIGNLVIFIKRK